MRIYKYKNIIVVILIFSLLLLKLISSFQNLGFFNKQAVSVPKQKIKFWMHSSSNNSIQAKLIDQFNKENDNIEVDYEVFGDNYTDMLRIALKSGNLPDIFELQSSITIPELVQGGFVEPLDDYLTKDLKSRFYPEVFLDKECTYKGHIYALPERYTFYTLLYNKDLFRKSGLDPNKPPETLEELREDAKRITYTGKGNFYGFALPLKSLDSVWNWTVDNMAAVNAKTADYGFDWSKGRFDFLEQKPFLEFLTNLKADRSILPDEFDMNVESVRVNFANNKVGMIIDGNFMNNIYRNEVKCDIDWGMSRIPTFAGVSPAKGILYLTQARLISSQSKNKQAAWKVLEYIFNHQDTLLKQGRSKSTIIDANKSILPKGIQEKHEEMMKLQSSSYTNFRIAPHRFIDITGMNRDRAYLGIYQGELNIDETLKKLTDSYNKALDKAVSSGKVDKSDVIKENFNYYLR